MAMPSQMLMDPAGFDLDHVIADREAIRKINPQRQEMEQIDAVVYLDRENHIIAGYKDVRPDEFWVSGHMPGDPLLPGVLMCEAAAQLCSYYVCTQVGLAGDFLAFAGMDNVRFRGTVRPGDRMVLVAKGTRVKPRQTVCQVQGFVGSKLIFEADIIGMPLRYQGPRDEG
jgi:3-hydroxyacyl-[acyl-carrier-protein] dehydratase